ncbi:MAG TPA: hypothetical protein VFK70_18750 [Vicinamibacteria bacterium]|nr:hypothetical protein [Vicinamibacteria bacterium]
MADPATLFFRHVLEARLEALFPRGARLLHVGRGRGDEAPALAARGIRVVGVDPSPEAIHAAGGGFDGAYASLGARGPADLPGVGAALGAALRAGAAIVVSLAGPWPLPSVIRRTFTGVGDERRWRGGRFAEGPPAVASSSEARTALGSAFVWTDAYALGVLVPGPAQERWAAEHPQAFGVLAALERGVRRWPGLRQLGDLSVLEGRRREPA